MCSRGRTRRTASASAEVYSLTVDTALASVERVLSGERKAGFQMPAGVYGSNLILSIPRVSRTDEEIE
jgi:hypothetical protein